MMVWGLCMDQEGNFVRNPNEILHEWTYEQVADAWELKQWRSQAQKDAEAKAKARKR